MDFKVTKQMLEEASDYLPLEVKTVLARRQAETCVQRAKEQTAVKTDAGQYLPLPPRYFCDEMGRSVLEMSVFTALYLHVENANENGDIDMTVDTYNRYAGAHIFGQLTEMKSGAFGRDNPKLKAKIIHMLADFNDYQRRLTSEIRTLMTLYNDPVDRFLAMNAAMTTPESMRGLMEDLKSAMEEAETYKAGEGA